MRIGLGLLLSFLLGSIPTAYILVRSLRGMDVRQMGSGNVGSMNVRDQLGYGPALLVLFIDAAKGAAAVLLGKYLGFDPGLCLGMAVAGHIYPPWLRFQGGKGIATALGGVLMLWWWQVLLVFAIIWIPCYLLSAGESGDWANLAGGLGIAVYGFSSGPQWGMLMLGCLIALKHFQVLRKGQV